MPLVVDLRDIAEQWGDNAYFTRKITPFKKLNYLIGKIYERKQLRIRNHILRNANAVTSVSPWHQATLAHYNNNSHLIYNGYDALVFTPKDITSDFFYITYLGKLYSTHLRDPRLLFEALRQLAEEKKIDDKDVLRVNEILDFQDECNIIIAVGYMNAIEIMIQLENLGVQSFSIYQLLKDKIEC